MSTGRSLYSKEHEESADLATLFEVMTISEVQRWFHLKNRSTVMSAIILGHVVARKTEGLNGQWLLSKRSATVKWGHRRK